MLSRVLGALKYVGDASHLERYMENYAHTQHSIDIAKAYANTYQRGRRGEYHEVVEADRSRLTEGAFIEGEDRCSEPTPWCYHL